MTGEKRHGVFAANGTKVSVWVGERKSDRLDAPLLLDRPEFLALAITPLDGLPLETSRKVLIAACGRRENTGMRFSPDRRTVGHNWGSPPVQIEPVSGRLEELPSSFRVNGRQLLPLGPDGRASGKPLRSPAARPQDEAIELSPRSGTM